jgi:hypothetical protein
MPTISRMIRGGLWNVSRNRFPSADGWPAWLKVLFVGITSRLAVIRSASQKREGIYGFLSTEG